MKNRSILLLALASLTLAGCGDNPTPNDPKPQGSSNFDIADYGTAKFEAENFDSSKWVSDSSYNGKVIISNENASGGAYLAAGALKSTGVCTFKFTLAKYSKVVFSAAYAQMSGKTSDLIDLSKTYFYNIESVSPFTPGSNNVLATRNNANKWDLIEYQPQTLAAGTYNVTLSILEDAPKSCPSIDYVQFVTTDPNADVKPDTSTLSEDDIPDNVSYNLQQYKYIVDGDWTTYATYADGRDLSSPRGMKLRFDEVDDSASYVVQVSTDPDDFSKAKQYTTTTKYLYFHNAFLSTTYYYRAATDEASLDDAEIHYITSSAQTPRVIEVPTVKNFRDIGGWATSLVPGAKIKEGLYYRCAQFQGSGSQSAIDTASIPLIKELGITRDIDMRDSYNVKDPSPITSADWEVKVVKASIASGTESTRWEAFGDVYTLIFNTIADADNNPVALHCTYGADRTGIASFFLEALLGMSLDDIKMDYVWTKFTKDRDPNPDGELKKWIEKTETNYPDEDCFANQMRAHLETKGISRQTLEHIREIFIPGYVVDQEWIDAAPAK